MAPAAGRFPKKVELWDRDGAVLRQLADLPLAEDIPVAFNSCRKGPRSLGWRSDVPAEISWIECQDGGDPNVEVSPRDIVYTLDVQVTMSPCLPHAACLLRHLSAAQPLLDVLFLDATRST